MTKYGSLIHKKWIASKERPDMIIGYWSEDYSEYIIIVPSQLRDLLLHLQNCLSEKYCKILELERQIKEIKNIFTGISC